MPIKSQSFFLEVTEALSVLKLFRRYLRAFDSDGVRINKVLLLTMKLEADIMALHLDEEKKTELLDFYRKRRDEPVSRSVKVVLLQDIHWVSYALDPNADMTSFNPFQVKERTRRVIARYCKSTYRSKSAELRALKEEKLMQAFSTEQFTWRTLRLGKTDAGLRFYKGRPLQYWGSSLCRDAEFKEFAMRVLSASPTACAVERSFSAMKRIHTKLRNRLRNEKIRKLMFCYWNLRVQLAAASLNRMLLWEGEEEAENEQLSRISSSVSGSQGSSLGVTSGGESLAEAAVSGSEGSAIDLWNLSDDDVDDFFCKSIG